MATDRSTMQVSQDVRARHTQMMAASGATGRPEDYRGRLSYLLPFRGPPLLLVFCGCCQSPLEVLPRLGLWVGWQANGEIAPLCAVCLEVLRGDAPSSEPVHVLPEYDLHGRRYCSALAVTSPVELAQRRMADVEARLPSIEGVNAADLARQVVVEAAETLQGLARVWHEQRDARRKLGRIVLDLQRRGTPEAVEELAGVVAGIPGAMQAAREAGENSGGHE